MQNAFSFYEGQKIFCSYCAKIEMKIVLGSARRKNVKF